jgi:flagellin
MEVTGLNNYQTYMSSVATGKRINTAANDAAGLAITQKMQAQIGGAEQGTRNAHDMQNLLRTGEGALANMHDSLQRIRELAVMAQSPIMAKEDKAALQKEVSSLKEHIQGVAVNTEFNGIKLLEGSFADKQLASSPSGGGMKISIQSTTLETLGIKDFDLRGDFSLESIDQAIEMVSKSRSSIGAADNRIAHTIQSNTKASNNLAASKSQIQDADIAKQLLNLNVIKILDSYKMFMQKQETDSYTQKVNLLG